MFKIGDKVQTTKRIQFKFGHPLEVGTILTVVEYNNDGIYKCKRTDDSPIVYSMLTHQIEPFEHDEGTLWFYLKKTSQSFNYIIWTEECGFMHFENGKMTFDFFNAETASPYRKADANRIAQVLCEKYKRVYTLKRSGMTECYRADWSDKDNKKGNK